jgi:hypothetical protein
VENDVSRRHNQVTFSLVQMTDFIHSEIAIPIWTGLVHTTCVGHCQHAPRRSQSEAVRLCARLQSENDVTSSPWRVCASVSNNYKSAKSRRINRKNKNFLFRFYFLFFINGIEKNAHASYTCRMNETVLSSRRPNRCVCVCSLSNQLRVKL